MPAAICVEGLSKRFHIGYQSTTLRETIERWGRGSGQRARVQWALRDVNFTIEQGSAFGIIGHNGAGKSTLLRLLCGLGRPTTGKIISYGRTGGILELGGGFHGDLTGRQNIRTIGVLNGLTLSEIRSLEPSIIRFAELEEAIDQPVKTYSNGMYLRLAFSAAIEFQPHIFVIDEVLSVGDERFQEKCRDRIAGFRKEGVTLILTSHNTQEITNLCDEVLVLDEGRVVMQGAPDRALSFYHDLMQQRTERRKQRLPIDQTIHPIQALGSRQGTQESSITSVRMLNVSGTETDTLSTGDSLHVRLEVSAQQKVSDMAVSVGVFSDAHVKCFEAIIPSVQAAFGHIPRHGILHCHMKELSLLKGEYFINVGLYPTDWSFVYDFHWQMHPLHIKELQATPSNTVHRGGILSIETDWHVESLTE